LSHLWRLFLRVWQSLTRDVNIVCFYVFECLSVQLDTYMFRLRVNFLYREMFVLDESVVACGRATEYECASRTEWGRLAVRRYQHIRQLERFGYRKTAD